MTDITVELGDYLKKYAVDLVIEELVEGKDLVSLEGNMRARCYMEIRKLFDDAMNEFCCGEVLIFAIDSLTNKIKDLLYERTSDGCCHEDEIDIGIGKLEKRIEKLRELE